MPAATLIQSLPNFISRENHTALVSQTPSSFNDIPPVVCHIEQNVSVTLDPPLDGFAQSNAQGTLYVIESVLVFMPNQGSGFQVEYPAITLHAVSRAESGPSIYCQLDEHAGEPESAAVNDEVSEMRELSIIPQDSSSLEPIFEALSRCAALHPDPATGSDEEDMDAFLDSNGSDFEVFAGDEHQELSEVGRAALEHLESIIEWPVNGSTHGSEPGVSDEENPAA